MKKNINTAAIMSRAHEITRASIRPGDCYRVNFSAALRITWAEALEPAAVEAWNALNGEEKNAALLKMVWHTKKRDEAAEDRAPVADWIKTADDAQTVASAAFIRLYDFRILDKVTEAGKPLAVALYRAVYGAARQIKNAELRHARALRDTVNDDGETIQAVDLAAGPAAERIAPGPEEAAILRDTISRAARDDKDRAIIRLLAVGYNHPEIAARIGMSRQAIEKRINGIQSRYDA